MWYARLFTLPMTGFHHAEDGPGFTEVYSLLLSVLERADCLVVAHGGSGDEPLTEKDYLFYVE